MDYDNPYAPGAGRVPISLAGRADLQITWRRSLAEVLATGRTSQRGLVLTGERGMGKTALLSYFEKAATDAGFGVVSVQAGGVDRVRDYLHAGLRELEPGKKPSFTDKHGRMTELSLGVGPVNLSGTREFPPGTEVVSPTENQFLEAVRDAAERFRTNGTGVVILIDEAHAADPASLTSVCRVAHLLRDPALQIAMAGLPELEDRLDEAAGHADRLFEYHDVGALDGRAAIDALRDPALKHGVEWQPGALRDVLECTGGHPSFVQEYGYAVWAARGDADVITPEIVARGVAQAQRTVARQFRSVWRAATPAGRACLRGLAEHGGPARITDIAASLGGADPQLVGIAVHELRQAGALSSPRAGMVDFVRPGMGAWIRGNAELLDAETAAQLAQGPQALPRPAAERAAGTGRPPALPAPGRTDRSTELGQSTEPGRG